jgi:hypothetical protein
MAGMIRPTLDDPLAGVRAVALARNVALSGLRAYAVHSRGSGRNRARHDDGDTVLHDGRCQDGQHPDDR